MEVIVMSDVDASKVIMSVTVDEYEDRFWNEDNPLLISEGRLVVEVTREDGKLVATGVPGQFRVPLTREHLDVLIDAVFLGDLKIIRLKGDEVNVYLTPERDAVVISDPGTDQPPGPKIVATLAVLPLSSDMAPTAPN
jgi:hypothetical protein